MIQNWLAILTIIGLLMTAVYQLVKVVIQIYSLLEQIKQSCLASDQVLNERIDHLEYGLVEVKREVKDIRGVIRRSIPNSFMRSSDHATDHSEDRHP